MNEPMILALAILLGLGAVGLLWQYRDRHDVEQEPDEEGEDYPPESIIR